MYFTNKFCLLSLLLISYTTLVAQLPDSCYLDPSCQQAKQMLQQAQNQWGNEDITRNSNARSEAIDILHYSIMLDMRAMDKKYIQGHCTIKAKAKKTNVQQIQLDLLQLQVDSVQYNGRTVNFNYNDTIITINFNTAWNPSSTQKIKVFYQGKPQKDGSWGGFYYTKDYAYNMGVGFASNPHNYGRVWHPCFDNFIEKATYDFEIITKPNQVAHCNGFLLSSNQRADKNTSRWGMDKPIPTYLACVAVSDYVTLKDTYQGAYEAVPIELVAQVTDTTNLQQSFKHLKQAIKAYEYWYGPHRFNKVGYSLVPFNAGAMEHATNIAYPIYAANGTLRWESLMAHELGHSWWGNNVTCLTGQDMWINEGMASYSVHLFYEEVYGKKRYQKEVKNNHINVLLNAHKAEGGYRPISGVPFEYTYGTHVYKKGAVVAHNLRGYLGDSLFRIGLQHIQEQFKFQNISSIQMLDELSRVTQVNLTPFFDNWVFSGGYPDFCMQAYTIQPNMILLKAKQYLVGRTQPHTQVPLEVTLWSKDWKKHTATVVANPNINAAIPTPFEPVAVILNQSHQLNQGSIDFEMIINQDNKAAVSFPAVLGLEYLEIEQLQDSALLHIKYHQGKLDSNDFERATPHPASCWSVNGIFPDSFVAKINFKNKFFALGDTLYYKPFEGGTWQPALKTGQHYRLQKGLYCWTKKENPKTKPPTLLKKEVIVNKLPYSFSIENNKLHLTSNEGKKETIYVELQDSSNKKIKCKKLKVSKDGATVKLPTQAVKAIIKDNFKTTIQIYMWE